MLWKITRIASMIVLLLSVAVAVLLWLTFRTPAPPKSLADSFTLDGVTVINPRVSRVENQSVTVSKGKISRLGVADSKRGAPHLAQFRGMYVFPGLLDVHSHMPPSTLLNLTEYSMLLYTRFGVTTVRDPGDGTGTADPAARAALARGVPGPRLFTCGPFVVGNDHLRWKNSVIVRRPEDADGAVQRIQDAGNMCVKAYEDLTVPTLRALEVATAKRGMMMPGHVPYGVDYVVGAVPEVQHLFGVARPASLKRDHLIDRSFDWSSVDEVRMNEVVAATLQNHTINVPTLVSTSEFLAFRSRRSAHDSPSAKLMPRLFVDIVWDPHDGLLIWRGMDRHVDMVEASLLKKRELVRRLYEAHAPLMIGTDTGQPFTAPGLAVHDEMKQFALAGIPAEDVWAIATWKSADLMRKPELGRVAPGAEADFIIFRDDPTRNLAALDSIAAVAVGGRLYTREELDARIADWKHHFDNPIFDAISARIVKSIVSTITLRDY